MINRLQITADSKGGARFIDHTGRDFSGAVTGCEISMSPGAVPVVMLDVVAECDIAADGLLSLDSLRAMAEHHGYKLIKVDE